jgi:hypothetical protein
MPTTKSAPKKSASKGGAGNDVVSAYIAQQSPEKRDLLEKLRAIVEKTLPDATGSIKWGVAVYQRNGRNICALASFKEFVGINFLAPPSALPDPAHKLEGEGKTQRMLKVRTAKDIDSASVARWLKAAAAQR